MWTIGDKNREFHDIVESAISFSADDSEIVLFASDGNLLEDNWKENQNGQDYQRRISAEGSPDVLGWVRDFLYPRVQEVYREHAERNGWGEVTEIEFDQSIDQTEVIQPNQAP